MSLYDTERIDAAYVKSGWATLSIYHFDEWKNADEMEMLLRAKLDTYDAFINSVRFLHSYYMAPVMIELQVSEIAPPAIRRLCADRGVMLLDPTTADADSDDGID